MARGHATPRTSSGARGCARRVEWPRITFLLLTVVGFFLSCYLDFAWFLESLQPLLLLPAAMLAVPARLACWGGFSASLSMVYAILAPGTRNLIPVASFRTGLSRRRPMFRERTMNP